MKPYINTKEQVFSFHIFHYIFTIKGEKAPVCFSERNGYEIFTKIPFSNGWRIRIENMKPKYKGE